MKKICFSWDYKTFIPFYSTWNWRLFDIDEKRIKKYGYKKMAKAIVKIDSRFIHDKVNKRICELDWQK